MWEICRNLRWRFRPSSASRIAFSCRRWSWNCVEKHVSNRIEGIYMAEICHWSRAHLTEPLNVVVKCSNSYRLRVEVPIWSLFFYNAVTLPAQMQRVIWLFDHFFYRTVHAFTMKQKDKLLRVKKSLMWDQWRDCLQSKNHLCNAQTRAATKEGSGDDFFSGFFKWILLDNSKGLGEWLSVSGGKIIDGPLTEWERTAWWMVRMINTIEGRRPNGNLFRDMWLKMDRVDKFVRGFAIKARKVPQDGTRLPIWTEFGGEFKE